jgi:Nuclease A inhibitor-like protein
MNTTNRVDTFKAAVEGLLWMSESDYPFEVSSYQMDAAMTPEQLLTMGDRSSDTPVVVQSVAEFFAPVLSRIQGMEPVAEGSLESLATDLKEPPPPDQAAVATDAEPASQDQRLMALMAMINATLTDAIVYRVGEIEIDIYIVGRVSPEEWLMISTRAIET